MPSSLVKSIEKLINTKVAAYNKLVSEKFDIDVKELEKLWNEASGTKENVAASSCPSVLMINSTNACKAAAVSASIALISF